MADRKRSRGVPKQGAHDGAPPLKSARHEKPCLMMAANTLKAAQACGYTQATLVGLLKEIDKGEMKYGRYFFKNKDGTKMHPTRDDIDDDIDRCKACGCTIDQHSDAAVMGKAGALMMTDPLAVQYDTVLNATLSDELSAASHMRTLQLPEGCSWPCAVNQRICLVRQAYAAVVQAFLGKLEQNVVVIGQPGIGKSFLGCYALHCFLNAGHTVIYAIRERVYVFDAKHKTATKYLRTEYYYWLDAFPDAILIHDCERETTPPPTGKTSRVFVLSSPMEQQFKSFSKQTQAAEKYVDVWSDDELKDACHALALDQDAVMQRRWEFGPIPRHCFSEDSAAKRRVEVEKALSALSRTADVLQTLLAEPADDVHPSHKLMMMKLLEHPPGLVPYVYVPCNAKLLNELYMRHGRVIQRTHDAWLRLIQHADRGWEGTTFEQLYAPTLLRSGELQNLLQRASELTSAGISLPTVPTDRDLKGVQLASKPEALVELAEDTLYWSESKSFAVVDWFVVHDGHFVGLQFTVAASHQPSATAIGGLYNAFANAFGKDAWHKIKKRSVVFVQRPIDEPMRSVQAVRRNFHSGRQKCTPAQWIPYDQPPKQRGQPTKEEVTNWNNWAEREWARFSQFVAAPYRGSHASVNSVSAATQGSR